MNVLTIKELSEEIGYATWSAMTNRGDVTEVISFKEAKLLALEFAKLHCIEQARVISEEVKTKVISEFEVIVDKDSILNAYSLDLIK